MSDPQGGQKPPPGSRPDIDRYERETPEAIRARTMDLA
jgi:hypothetical protein